MCSVRGLTGCSSVGQGECRHLCDYCSRFISELPCNEESILEELMQCLCSCSPVPTVCTDEAPVGRSIGACLLCCVNHVCVRIQPCAFPQRQSDLCHKQEGKNRFYLFYTHTCCDLACFDRA